MTDNLSDFPVSATAQYNVETISADDFMLNQLDLAPGVVMRVLHDQAAAHRREPYTVEGLLTSLERAGLVGFAAEARRHLPPVGA